MSDAIPEPDPTPPLPEEAPSRAVPDADARGIPVVLQGGETWFVLPLPLSPRGQKIAGLMDAIEDAEVDLAVEQKRVALLSGAVDAVTEADATEGPAARLRGAIQARRAATKRVEDLYRELAYHALRSLYRVTIEQAAALVTTRRFPDIVAALNGRDTERSQQEQAIELFRRLQMAAGKGTDGDRPLGSATPSAGHEVSSSPADASPTA